MIDEKDKITIIVNGRQKVVASDEVSYDDVLSLAYDPVPSGPDILFTVTFRNGAGRPPTGTLTSGRKVKIKDGTTFNVTVTDKS